MSAVVLEVGIIVLYLVVERNVEVDFFRVGQHVVADLAV